MNYPYALVIISDTCATDNSKDQAGRVLEELIGSPPALRKFVPDKADEICRAVKLAASHCTLVLTSGGTGLSATDVTTDALSELIEKRASGLELAMMTAGLQKTPFAALSRPLAGTIGNSLVIALPGSPKGAVENLEAVLQVLPHAMRLVTGANSRKEHAARQSFCSGSHGHHHVDHHLGPKFYGPAARLRESPYPLTPFETAQDMILRSCPEPQVTTVPLMRSLGRTIAADIVSPLNVPSFRASIVDGYAVIHGDCPGTLTLSHASTAGTVAGHIETGFCARINTGAPVPMGATAVVPVENTRVVESKDGEEVSIAIDANVVVAGDNIREIGSDMRKGELVLPSLAKISAVGGEIGALASIGTADVPVYKTPSVAIFSTGNELVPVGDACEASMVYDSNRPMLIANMKSWGLEIADFGIVKDNVDDLEEAVKRALDKSDILITTGGVSMGEHDFLKPVIERLGGKIHFGRVMMKPGKPMTFASIGKNKFIFALPGNPASCSVCLNLFVRPFIRKWEGDNDMASRVQVTIMEQIHLDSRPEFRRAFVESTLQHGLVGRLTGSQRSSRVSSLVRANALLCLPARTDDVPVLGSGSIVTAIMIM